MCRTPRIERKFVALQMVGDLQNYASKALRIRLVPQRCNAIGVIHPCPADLDAVALHCFHSSRPRLAFMDKTRLQYVLRICPDL